MKEGQRHESEWEGLRLVVDECQDHFQAFVYDPAQCEVVYTAARMTLDTAKVAAVEFAVVSRFGPHHDLRPEVIAVMLVWERVSKD